MWLLYCFVNKMYILYCCSNFIVSPLQPWYFDTKKYQIEIGAVTKNGFLLADSKFEVYQEREIKKC